MFTDIFLCLVIISPWPLLLSTGFLNLTLSGGASLHHFSSGFLVFIVTFIMIVTQYISWNKDVVREATFLENDAPKMRTGLRERFLLFVASEAMLFMAIFWSFFHSSLAPAIALGLVWPPIYLEILNPYEIPLVNTLILLTSRATITLAHHGILQNKHKLAKIAFFITIVPKIKTTRYLWGNILGKLPNKRNHTGCYVADNNFTNNYYLYATKHPMKIVLVSRNSNTYTSKRYITSGTSVEAITSLNLLLKISIIFSILLGLLRIFYVMQYQNKIIFDIVEKSKKLFCSVFLSVSLLTRVLSFSYKVTTAFLNPKNEKIADILTIVSGLTTGISFGCRVTFILFPTILITIKPLLLLFFGLNAAFRSIIGLGMLLRTGEGNPIWRHLLEQIGRNKQRPSNFGGPLSSNNPNMPQHHNPNTGKTDDKQQENSQYTQKRGFDWAKWNTIGVIAGTIIAGASYIRSEQKDGDEVYKRRHAEDCLAREKREREVEREVSEFEHKRNIENLEFEHKRRIDNLESIIIQQNEKFHSEIKRVENKIENSKITVDDLDS